MRTLKSHPLLKMVNSYLIDSAQPSNLSYWWNFGVRRASEKKIIFLPKKIYIYLRSFVRENCPILIVYSLVLLHCYTIYLEEELYKLWLATLPTSNKRLHWIAGKKRSRKSGLPSIMARVNRSKHVEDNELDTYKRDQFSGYILSRICRCIWSIVCSYNQIVAYWREASRCPGIRDSKDGQATKLTRTINGTIWEPRDLTASVRGRSLHTRSGKDGLKGDSPKTSDKYKTNSGRRKAERDDKKRPQVNSSKQTASSMVMETLNEWEKKNQKIRNLIKILSDPFYLVKSYEDINSVPGNMTKGAKPETLDKLSFEWFEKVALAIKTNQFEFSSSRRVLIPKPNSTKTRPLTIASPRDKIVQKAVQLILQAIWDSKFLDSSHGFRPNRSVHTALRSIYSKGQTYNWVVQGDISKCFDRIPHSIVIDCLKQYIADAAFLNLIRKFLTAGHIEPKSGRLVKCEIGVPQGGVLTPILCNIVLHKFDEFMANLISNFYKGKKIRHNPEYQKVQSWRKTAKTQKDKLKYLQLKRSIPHGDPMDPNFKRMMYVRYADDFVILVIGSKDDAALAKLRAKDALKRLCGAELSEEKTLITHAGEGFQFLGAYIRKLDKNTELLGKTGIGDQGRVFTRRLLMNAPMPKLIANLEKAGMIKRNSLNQCIPISCTKLTNLTHYDIVSFYNLKINGILNFYSFASNYRKLGTLIWYMRLSCALTLARKNKLGTARKAFNKYGSHLEDPETGVRIIIPKSMKVTHRFQANKELPDPATQT